MTLNVEIQKRRLADFNPQAVNARFMRKETFDRLVANIRADGRLTSLPLIYEPDPAVPGDIVSGHHRIEAAMTALGRDHEDHVLVVRDEQSKQQIIARQLSHNAIEGEDDPATLKALYEQLDDVDWRAYAGLDDKTLDLLTKVDVQGLSEANLDFQTVTLVFLPAELERAQQALDDARKLAGTVAGRWVAALAQYDPTLDALETAHAAWKVGNVATALGLILDVFEANLEATQAGWLDGDGEPRRKEHVPVESMLGTRAVPPDAAAVIVRAAKKVRRDAGDREMPLWRAVELACADYLGGA
jgi:hypothetical protein